MESDSSSDEQDLTSFKRNAFDVLMQPTSKKAKVDPIYIAVIYIRWLKWIDQSEPLHMCPYVGQAVRPGPTAERVAGARWKEENNQAMRESKDIGLIHCIDVYGPDAFEDQIVEWKRGPRSELQLWANKREIELIAKHGGMFRNPSLKCNQTLNLTNGGQGNVNFESRDAFVMLAWLRFKKHLEEYVTENSTSLVLARYVSVSGYRLGERVHHVRNNEVFLQGLHGNERKEWLESLPDWSWSVKRDKAKKAWETFKSEIVAYVSTQKHSNVPLTYKTASGYNLGQMVSNVRNQHLFLHGFSSRKEWVDKLAGWSWNRYDAKWEKFKDEMQQFVSKYNNSSPSQKYVSPSGYKLGGQLSNVRHLGRYIKGNVHELQRLEWITSLPNWKWCVCLQGQRGAGSSSEHVKLTEVGSAVAATRGVDQAVSVAPEQQEGPEEVEVAVA